MFHFKDNFVEVIWSMEVEAEAEVEAKRHHFHITVPNNQAAATAAT